MTDRIEIIGLRVRGFHGVLDSERQAGQDFVVDALLDVDIKPSALADDLELTVDYAALSADLAAVVAGEPVDLIETLAERLAVTCLSRPQVASVELVVHKPQAPVGLPFEDIRVRIRRP